MGPFAIGMKYILVIAGSDSCGGAGLQADIKTITGLGGHALNAVTALTAQNSLGVEAVYPVPPEFISRQIESVVSDVTPQAVKVGMLFSKEAVKEICRLIERYRLSPVVVDPVLRASTGGELLEPEGLSLLRGLLLPLASVVTPNLDEAAALSGRKEVSDLRGMEEAAGVIKDLGPDVVVTGGHLTGRCVDLFYDGRRFEYFEGPRIETNHTHGTGCVFSSAMAVFLAMGRSMSEAVGLAHEFTRTAIKEAYPCGRGAGPVNPGRASILKDLVK